jgi:hypothetical protein
MSDSSSPQPNRAARPGGLDEPFEGVTMTTKLRIDDGRTGEVREFLTLMAERARSVPARTEDAAGAVLLPEEVEFTPLHEGLPPVKAG